MRHISTWVMVLGWSFLFSGVCEAGQWRTNDGLEMKGNAIAFDYETKVVTLENEITQARATYKSNALDFPSKRLLLFSPAFHKSYPPGRIWPKEKFWLFGLAILSPVVLLISGMWIAGIFVARKFNPFKAVGAFLGSWIAGVVLTICYLVFAQKSDGGMFWIYGGILLASLVMALFISAMYQTSFVRGILIFVGHVLFAGLFGYILLYGMDKFIPADQVAQLWEKWVFLPTGLLGDPLQSGY